MSGQTGSYTQNVQYYRFGNTTINISQCNFVTRFGAQIHFSEKRNPKYEPDIAGGFTLGKRVTDRSLQFYIQYASVATATTELARIGTMISRSYTVGNTIYNLSSIRSFRLNARELMLDFDGKIYVETFGTTTLAQNAYDDIWTQITRLI
jgi:hypothetical protein